MSKNGYGKKIKSLVITGIIIVVFIMVSLLKLNDYFTSENEIAVNEALITQGLVGINKLKAAEDSTLKSYELLDSTGNTYRIPLNLAMELVAAEKTIK